MSADLDTSTSQGAVDTASVSETSTTTTDDSVWESYPDNASSEAGNTPEIAHLNQGNPDSPNGWGDYDPADYDQYDNENDWGDDYGETAGGGDDEEPDPWGGTYPDAAYPADSSNDTGRVETQETDRTDPAAADSGTDNGEPDQEPADAADSEHPPTAEQQRISALETKNADTQQQLSETQQQLSDTQKQLADTQQQIADLKASVEQLRKDDSGPESKPPPRAVDRDKPHDADSSASETRPLDSTRRALSETEKDAGADKHEKERPDWWSDAKLGLYGAAAAAGPSIADAAVHPEAIPMLVAGGAMIATATASVVAWRERRRRRLCSSSGSTPRKRRHFGRRSAMPLAARFRTLNNTWRLSMTLKSRAAWASAVL
jgi:uncharacterized coiled-coil protein SlyX